MGYAGYLTELLRPLGLYELHSGPGAAELRALGGSLDLIAAALERAERESVPPTAEGEGLERWESVLPFYPCYRILEDRRRAVMSLARIDGASFTPAAVNDTLAGCGIVARAEETGVSGVRVSFPNNRGVPPDLQALKERIEAIVPCHLAVEYYIILITWRELETLFPAWSDLNAAGLTWDQLMRSGGGE